MEIGAQFTRGCQSWTCSHCADFACRSGSFGPEQYAAAVSVVKQAAVAAGELMYPQPIDLNVYPWRVAADSRLLQVQENGRMSQAALIADLPDLRGDTAIHLVREASTAEALLSGGACPNLRNNEGATALHTAVRRREEVAHEHLAEIQRRRGQVILPKQRSSFPDQRCLIIALLKGCRSERQMTPRSHALASGCCQWTPCARQKPFRCFTYIP